MRCLRAVGLVPVLGMFLASSALAAAPQIKDVVPFGVQRGKTVDVVVSGANLAGNPRIIAGFPVKVEPAPGSDASSFKIKVTVDPSLAVGVYPFRVQTDDGISNPFLLAVGQLPQVVEKEENSAFELAQLLPGLPIVVEGRAAGNDVDYFRFHGKQGQKIVIDAQCARIGSGIDPTIRLTTATAKRTYVASADDTPGLVTDARLTAELPENSDYVVEISDTRYQGAGRAVYRLVIGQLPVAAEVYPLGGRVGETIGLELRGGTLKGVAVAAATVQAPFGTDLFQPRIPGCVVDPGSTSTPELDFESVAPLVVSHYPEVREPTDGSATPILAVAPVVLNGRIESPGNEDRFRLAATPGSRLRIAVHAYDLGSSLDPVITLIGKDGKAIGSADDETVKLPKKKNQPQTIIRPDPLLEITVPSGTTEVTVVIRDLERRGGVGYPYRIVVEPLEPDFELAADVTEVNVPRGGTIAVGVNVRRKGYKEAIEVNVDGPPAGLTVRPATIAAGQSAGALTLSASADAAFTAIPLRLVGRGKGASGTIERVSATEVVFASLSNLPTSSRTEYGLLAAPAQPTPATLDIPSTPIEVAHGFGAVIPVKATRTKGADAALAFTGFSLPGGVTIPGDSIPEKKNEANVRVQTAVAAPLGTSTLVLQAKGKLGGADRILFAPAVTISIVRPASVELATKGIEIKPGATVEIKGKVVRKGTFKEPVTVRVNGLPAGLKAEPATVAADASDFVIKVVADAKAAPASAKAQIALAFQVNKKDYPIPTTPMPVKVLPAK